MHPGYHSSTQANLSSPYLTSYMKTAADSENGSVRCSG